LGKPTPEALAALIDRNLIEVKAAMKKLAPRTEGRGMNPRPLCRHCKKEPIARPRGLGWRCYYTPGVKELYPSTSKFARRGVGNGFRSPLPPQDATTAPPGTPEKVAVMRHAAASRQGLWHPDDARRTAARAAKMLALIGTPGLWEGGRLTVTDAEDERFLAAARIPTARASPP
jgi:hypothetical protein